MVVRYKIDEKYDMCNDVIGSTWNGSVIQGGKGMQIYFPKLRGGGATDCAVAKLVRTKILEFLVWDQFVPKFGSNIGC